MSGEGGVCRFTLTRQKGTSDLDLSISLDKRVDKRGDTNYGEAEEKVEEEEEVQEN
jgi:hypothetical protein